MLFNDFYPAHMYACMHIATCMGIVGARAWGKVLNLIGCVHT